jgi:hypothetical protein
VCRLDSIGLAGFSHDFGALKGQSSRVGELLESTSRSPVSFIEKAVILFQPSLPFLTAVPTMRAQMRREFKGACGKLARGLLVQTAQNEGSAADQKSILGLLSWCLCSVCPPQTDLCDTVKAENATMTEDEVNSQVCLSWKSTNHLISECLQLSDACADVRRLRDHFWYVWTPLLYLVID